MKFVKTVVFTGGHHTSSLVVAKALQAKGWRIVWFGHRYSMWGDRRDSGEYREVTAAGVKFYNLWAGKFYKTYNPIKLILIPVGFIHSLLLLLLTTPRGIVSFGGYLAVPVVVCGWLLGIPSITHEQTVVAGWANKLISLFVRKIAVSWPGSLNLYPKHKVILTGLPLRPEILKIKQQMTINDHELPRMTIYITGGKQGSHVINQVIFNNIAALTKKYNVIHQTGTATVFGDLQKARMINVPGYTTFGFDSAKALKALAAADVVVSRAGAHIIYELGFLGKRSVLIPIPWVSHHEQEKNAQILVDAGLAVTISESALTIKTLVTAIEKAKRLTASPMNLLGQAETAMVNLIEEVMGGYDKN